MDLNLKDIKRLADVCRKAGVKTCEYQGLKITLDDHYLPEPSSYQKRKMKARGVDPKSFIQSDVIPTDGPSAEELLYFSCGGPPEGLESEDMPS